MSDTERTVDRTGLEDLVEENPEAVADFIERLDAVNDLVDVLVLGTEAMDDEMVASLAGTSATLAEMGDGLATSETVHLAEATGKSGDDLTSALETLVDLERSGTLDDLAELATVASLVTAAMDDEMVASLAGTGASVGELADTATEADTVRGLESMLEAVGDASDPDDPPDPVGIWGLLAATRDPDVKRGMGYLLAISRALGDGLDAE